MIKIILNSVKKINPQADDSRFMSHATKKLSHGSSKLPAYFRKL